jgi:predicted RNase H-like nuclease (RuvC/YqgF family)
MVKPSLKAIKAQCANEIAKKYKRVIERLQKENGELKLLLAKYRNEISKLQHSLELERNPQLKSK